MLKRTVCPKLARATSAFPFHAYLLSDWNLNESLNKLHHNTAGLDDLTGLF